MAVPLQGFFGFMIPILGPCGSPGKCVNEMGLMADKYKRWSATIKVSTNIGRDDTIESLDEPMPAAAARTLLLALLRDRRPGDEAYTALLEAAGSYLRMNPDDAEVQEAWEEFTGRPLAAARCSHTGFLVVEPVEGGCAARCALCGTAGPVRYTSEAARKALLVLGARNVG